MSKLTISVGEGEYESIEFELTGKNADGKVIEPIGFRCLPEIQGAVLMNTLRKMTQGGAMDAVAIMDFIHACLPDDEMERFDEVTNSKDVILSLSHLFKVMTFLTEEYSKRLFLELPSSPTGRSTTTDTFAPNGGMPIDQTLPNSPSTNTSTSSMSPS